jgi:hypothetical protein
MAIKVQSYKWFKYNGREVMFHTGHEVHNLHLFKGEIFGYKKFKDHHYVVDKSNTEVRFELKQKDVDRIIRNSHGWTGKVDKLPVKAGVGGLDKPIQEQDTKDLHHLQIDSSNLKAATYDKKQKILTVTFHNGATWNYLGVTPKEARDLENAESQGRYFIYKIRSIKEQHKVSG